jgi:transcriptional antiterminator NusG
MPERYGCIFCRTGSEAAVVQTLHQAESGVEALVVMQKKLKSEKGKVQEVEQIMLPGYVFFKTEQEALPFLRYPYVLRVLHGSQEDWALRGSDEQFAKWVFQYNGVIGESKVYKMGDQVKIHSGPLKDWEGQIVKIDRKRRTGQVEVKLDNRVWRIWLTFDWLES